MRVWEYCSRQTSRPGDRGTRAGAASALSPPAGSYRMRRVSRVQTLLRLVAVILPQPVKRALFRQLLGWNVAADAYVGLSYIGAEAVTLGPGSRIGHFNIVRNVRVFELGRGAFIKDFNHIFGCPPVGVPSEPSFRLGDGGAVMSRHFFEAGGGITIGAGATIGGRGTHIYTHSLIAPEGGEPFIDIQCMRIGAGAKVFANAILVHCSIPPGAHVAAGAVVTKSYEAAPDECLLIAGNPATVVRRRPLVSLDAARSASGATA